MQQYASVRAATHQLPFLYSSPQIWKNVFDQACTVLIIFQIVMIAILGACAGLEGATGNARSSLT